MFAENSGNGVIKNRSPGFLSEALVLTLGQSGFPANYLCPLKFHQSVIGESVFLCQLLKNTSAAQTSEVCVSPGRLMKNPAVSSGAFEFSVT
jgi:hypothetical protein